MISWKIKAANEYFPPKLENLLGKSNSIYDREVVIANDYFVFNNVIDQQEELKIGGSGSGGGGGIADPISETAMVNKTKGMKILWGNCRGVIILLTKPSFSFLSVTFINMLGMWFCGDILKNFTPYRMFRAKYVMHVKGIK